MRAPVFWRDKGLLSATLLPAALLYNAVARVRSAAVTPAKLPVRVVCIGNLVAGGAGKTPVALTLGMLLKKRGIRAHYLSRGYKSDNIGVTKVDITQHSARDVGDEPLLLAEVLPTWVSKDRVAGTEAAIKAGAEIVIMDDGFQNPRLHKDVSLLVVDGHYGFGNERVIPAGPLREPIEAAMERASAVIMVGDDKQGVTRYVPPQVPVLQSQVKPVSSAEFLRGKQVVAFCGIARPRKFYRTLQELGCIVVHHVSYADHYAFTPGDLEFLRAKAKETASVLVTTEKDYVRLPDDMRVEVTVVPIEVAFDDNESLLKVVLEDAA